ncbi:hypothetical protein LPTSP3_g10780 [Leptospira kobayashii]|uniref:Uncharacterized protein n=1 Tax=Leptospira kobayashii TaxID=1917830 RepID=A0ABM7UHU9_9LEPT|nr:hypothetical protein LPTSP3_g10780 [Leptospira kobayashii]
MEPVQIRMEKPGTFGKIRYNDAIEQIPKEIIPPSEAGRMRGSGEDFMPQ